MGTDRKAGPGVPGGLSLTELCDVTYVLLLERVEKHATISTAYAAGGGEPDGEPSFAFSQESVDAWLAAAPAERTGQEELLHALGVR
ncbi:MAG: hypothetical protein ACXV5Q_00680 [Frankiaceae bacterium]